MQNPEQESSVSSASSRKKADLEPTIQKCSTYRNQYRQQDRPHAMIRETIIDAMQIRNLFDPSVVSAIALACHPWPDRTYNRRIWDAIAAELLPNRNSDHYDFLELATDRLLRIAEALRFEKEERLASAYADAANAIHEKHHPNTENNELACKSCVQLPWGIGFRGNQNSEVTNEFINKSKFDICWPSMITGVFIASMKTPSRDIGIMCKGQASHVNIDELAKHFHFELPEKIFDAYVISLDPRSRDILVSRTYALNDQETLRNLATRWNIVRERVRQIETLAKEQLMSKFANTFIEIGRRIIAPLTTRLTRTVNLHEAAHIVARNCRYDDMLTAFVIEIFGPWHTIGEWSYHEKLHDRASNLRAFLINQADERGFLQKDIIESACDGLFDNNSDRNRFLIEELGLAITFENWTIKNTLQCQLASALKKIGEPATKEELADLLCRSTVGITSTLRSIDGVVRADRYRWGFKEWVEDEYDGIVGEIEQRIEEHNGSVPVHILLRDIPSQFNVSEYSVRAYLGSTAFVVENEMVRSANLEEYVPKKPNSCPNAIKIEKQWAYKATIHERHFNGHSLGVSFHVAFANGIRPGDTLVVPIDGHDYEVSLIWRPHNITELVDVGRIGKFLTSQGYQAGDEVIIVPTQRFVKLISNTKNKREENKPWPLSEPVSRDIRSGEPIIGVSDPLLDLLGEP